MPSLDKIKAMTRRIDLVVTTLGKACRDSWIGDEQSLVVASALLKLGAKMLHAAGFAADEFDEFSRDTYLAAACEAGDCRDRNCPLHRSKLS